MKKQSSAPAAHSEPPFFQDIAADGKPWQMTPRLLAIQADLKLKMLRIENIADKGIQGAFIAVEMMQHRAMRLAKDGEELTALHDDEYFTDYLADDPPAPEEIRYMVSFLLPLAHLLTMPMPPCEAGDKWNQVWDWLPQTEADAQRLKKTALKWVSKVIDRRFSHVLMKPEAIVERALELIPVAIALCIKLNRPPYKEELEKRMREVYNKGERWKTDEETFRKARLAAGLEGLENKPRGKDKSPRRLGGT
ncbi:MAG: hypothetical protein V4675_22010 [Verrucomicrobiota bacterium]